MLPISALTAMRKPHPFEHVRSSFRIADHTDGTEILPLRWNDPSMGSRKRTYYGQGWNGQNR
jgi:hypothetical protein